MLIYKMALKKVSYGVTKIQKSRRIALDQNLLESLGLNVGDMVRVELDIENEVVLIKAYASVQHKSIHVLNPARSVHAKK